ncbi:MAG TPA: ABC transporter substrate-binding protein [Thermoanaerobaculia bacterium]|nr:ABC transporter substrate-binding protein [Thermoanaerobaculia bacterium]
MTYKVGERLANRYQIVSEIGRGGMGAVFLAHDPVLGRDVAVKVIPPQLFSDDAEERFRREARVVAGLDHPGIVPVHDFGHHEQSLFLVMSLIRGGDMRGLMEDRALSTGDILEIAVQVANALDCAHRSGVIHRDVKPENILVERDSAGAVRARVTDFGLAIANRDKRLTQAGIVVGTVIYLAPEQLALKDLDGRADIYALGTILYEALAGQAPFEGGGFATVFHRIATEIPPSLGAMGIDVPAELDALVMRCLAKDRDDRPPNARALAEELMRIRADLDQETSAQRTSGSLERRVHSRPTSLVGRRPEFETLRACLAAATSGEGRFAVIGGATGVGKTRLVDELESMTALRHIPMFRARCVDFDDTLPYNTLCQLVQQFFRVCGPEAGRQFGDLAPELTQTFPLLTDIPELRGVSSGTLVMPSDGSAPLRDDRTYIFEVLARCYIRMGGGKPMVLVFEDLHVANVTVDALQYIIHRLGPFPILILGTYRSDEADRRTPIVRLLDNFQGDRHFELVTVAPFTLAEHRAFLEHIVGSPSIDEQVVQRTYAVTDGNAHFASELTRSLLDSGEIVRQPSGVWALARDAAISIDALPASIQQAVERRLERLPKPQLETLSIASVLGREFNVRELQAIAEDGKGIEDDLDHLLLAGFLGEVPLSRGERMLFSSGVTREVVYGTLSRRKRRTLHRTFAEWLEKRNAGRQEMVYPQLVHHYAEGDVPEKVVEFGMKLARRSIDAFAEQDAIGAATAVITFVEDPLAKAEARTLLAEAYRMTSDTARALEEIEAAVRLFEAAGEKARALAAMCTAADMAWQSRRVDETRRWVERALPIGRELDDAGSVSRLLSLAAIIANLRADYTAAHRYLSEAQKIQPVVPEESQLPRGGALRVALRAALRVDEEPEVLANIRETLVATDEHGNPIPHLCERWRIADDGRTYTFVLRDGVLFHDGTPLDAGHVKRSIESAIASRKSGWDALTGAVEGVSDGQPDIGGLVVRSPRQLEIRLLRRLAMLPSLLSSPHFAIFRASGQASAAGADMVTGTGPFRLETADVDRITLVPFEGHWSLAPRVDRLEMRLDMTGAEATARFRSHDLDLVRDLSPAEIEAILEERHLHAAVAETAKKNVYVAMLNQQRPLGANPDIRRAVFGIVRIEQLVRRTLNRLARPATGLFPPGIAGHDAGRRLRAAQIEQVKEWLDRSGFTTPIVLHAAVDPALLERCGAFTRALIDAWKEIGIEVSIDTTDLASYLEKLDQSVDVDLVLGQVNAEYSDPHACVAAFHSRNGIFGKLVGNDEIDALVELGTTTVDPARREHIYGGIETQLRIAVLPLFHDIDCRVCSPAVRGLQLHSSAPYVNYDSVAVLRKNREDVQARAREGVLHVPMMYAIETLDPAHTGDPWHTQLVNSVFETLTRTNDRGVVDPWLARSFEVSESGRTCSFVLRDDVVFHDGRRMTARDVRHSFERVLRSGAAWNETLLGSIDGASEVLERHGGELAGVRVLSDTEIVFTLKEPVGFFPAILTFPSLSIVPEGTEEIAGTWRQSCVGSGPFRVTRVDPGRWIELEANPYYWRENLPRVEGLVAWLGVPSEEIASRFRSGRISLAYDMPPADYRALRHDTRLGPSYSEAPVLATCVLAFNVNSPVFSDRESRERVAASLDINSLVRLIDPRVAPATGIFPPGLLGHDPLPRSRPRSASGPSLQKIDLLVGAYTVFARIYGVFVEAAAERLRHLGFDPEIVSGKLLRDRHTAADLLFTRWVYDYPDSDNFVRGILETSTGVAGWACGNARIDHLIARGRSETNRDLRHEIYREIDEIVSAETLLLPLFHEQAYCFARPEVQGLRVRQFFPFVPFEELSVRG